MERHAHSGTLGDWDRRGELLQEMLTYRAAHTEGQFKTSMELGLPGSGLFFADGLGTCQVLD